MLQKGQSSVQPREYWQMTYLPKSHSVSRSDSASGDFQQIYPTDVVKGNTYVAASRTGLEKNEIAILQRSLPPRYDLRHLKNNESLRLLLQKEAGQSRVVTYKFTLGKLNYTAYRISDKKFYNLPDTGSRAGLDYPPSVTARLGSPFNPARLNPVSGKVSPYNDIDYPMPMDTKIVSVTSGETTQTGYNSIMGYFAEVSGKDDVKTRHLHSSKIFVRKGTPVSRGTTTALFGNSGRLSDLHLHCKLIINNNPVNSLTFRAAGPVDNSRLEQHAYTHAHGYGRYLD